MRPFAFKLLGVVTLIVSALIPLVTAPPTSAHRYFCGDGVAIRWPQSGTYHYVPNFHESYVTTITNAQTEFDKSDFKWTRVLDPSVADVIWKDYYNPNTAIAGLAYVSYDCSTPAPHHIKSGYTLGFNIPHFDASGHTTAQKQCTAIHEMGHMAGFDHNTLVSIMLDNHTQRCHSSELKALQSHDLNDINTHY